MFEWWHERKRAAILETPFPEAWHEALARNVAHYARLTPEEQQRLRELTQVFIAEKHWEGCGGLELTDEMRVTIAAQACLLVLELPHRMYGDVESILVYPSAVQRPERKQGVFVRAPDLVASGPVALAGEAHKRGPVVLAWDRVLRDGRHPQDGHNLVYHEFAHKLDMLDGSADGTPPLQTREELARWAKACETAFLALRAATERGAATVLDSYGASNEAEFFAVATEHFFDRPRSLQKHLPELYQVLAGFYRQDPAAREQA
jgi:Mlc titration factor MtfA (ptsG expression regulator)